MPLSPNFRGSRPHSRRSLALALTLVVGAAAQAGCQNHATRVRIHNLHLHLHPDSSSGPGRARATVAVGRPDARERPGRGGAPGRLSPALVQLANAVPLKRAAVRIDARGRVLKIGAYHGEAARMPESVRRLAEQQFPGSRVRELELELQRGIGRVHEVKVLTRDGRKCEVSANDQGQLLFVECHVPVAQIPPAIASAARQLVPRGEIVEAETKKGPNVDLIEVTVKAAGQVHKLHFAASGKLVGHFLRVPANLDIAVQR